MSKFDDNYRAAVVVMLQTEGYPQDEYALGRVHNYLKQRAPYPHKTTIMQWFRGTQNPPPLNKINDKKRDMAEALQELAWKYLDHAGDETVVSETSGQQAITSLGILIDKMRLVQGLPTQIIAIMPEFVSTMNQLGESPEEVLQRLIEAGRKKIDASN